VGLLLEATPPGSHSSNLGGAYLELGRALDAQDRREEARTAFRSALENLASTLGPDHPQTRAAQDAQR
jgi:hypothetical protein